MLESVGYAFVGLSAVNALVAGGLVAVYGGIYARLRTTFALGLLTFAGAFSVQNVGMALMYAFYMEMVPDALVPLLLITSLSELLGLGVMLRSAVV